MMRNLPVPVSEEEINEMFDFADKDKDGKINYRYINIKITVILSVFLFELLEFSRIQRNITYLLRRRLKRFEAKLNYNFTLILFQRV